MNFESRKYYESLEIRSKSDFHSFLKMFPVETLTDYDWTRLTLQGCFSTTSLIEKYADKLDWECLLFKQPIPEELIEKYSDKVNWFEVSLFQKLTWEFIKKHKKDLSFDELIKNEKLSYEVIGKCKEMRRSLLESDSRWQMHWNNIRQTSSIFRPKGTKKLNKVPDLFTEDKKVNKKESKKNLEIKEPQKLILEEKPKRTRLTEKKILEMNKAECKTELDKRGVKYLYKNTLSELREILLTAIRKK